MPESSPDLRSRPRGRTTSCGFASRFSTPSAITAVNEGVPLVSGTTITFASSLNGQTITLDAAQGTLTLNTDMTIDGTGATTVVDGGCTVVGGQCQNCVATCESPRCRSADLDVLRPLCGMRMNRAGRGCGNRKSRDAEGDEGKASR